MVESWKIPVVGLLESNHSKFLIKSLDSESVTMCTTWSTRNRANVYNRYTVSTLLVNKDCYCPWGPNEQDYRCRSRLYNPDPKYQCQDDLTCHQYDSKGKDPCCSGLGYQSVTPPVTYGPNQLACYTNGMCAEPGQWCPVTPRCRRRRIKPPSCCMPRPTYRDLIEFYEQCPDVPPCDNENCQDKSNNNPSSCPDPIEDVGDGGYQISVPAQPGDSCSSNISYECGSRGKVCNVQMPGGNNVRTKFKGCVVIEANSGGAGGGGCSSGPDCVDLSVPSNGSSEPQCNNDDPSSQPPLILRSFTTNTCPKFTVSRNSRNR